MLIGWCMGVELEPTMLQAWQNGRSRSETRNVLNGYKGHDEMRIGVGELPGMVAVVTSEVRHLPDEAVAQCHARRATGFIVAQVGLDAVTPVTSRRSVNSSTSRRRATFDAAAS